MERGFQQGLQHQDKGQGFLNKREQIQCTCKEEIFYNEGVETLAQAAWRGDKCLTPGYTQDKVEWSFEQPVLVEDVPEHCIEVELDDL